ncbi:MAG: molybdopterin dinucleotide binding domain-containing protein, partial [Pyrinomonadaceae bacterium]
WDDIVAESGLEQSQIVEAAEMFIAADRVITCWAMGLTQHVEAVATIQDVVNLHLLRGQIGKEGAGVCPVRGHSNVQGDRTMGIWEKVNEKFFAALGAEFDFTPPQNDGLDTVASIAAMRDRKAKVFFAMGGNFAVASPDTDTVFEALQKCRLTVQVLTKLNRTALAAGERSLILPCLGRSEIDEQKGREQFVTTESTMLNVQMTKGIFAPGSKHLRSEPWIVAKLAKAVLGSKTSVDWDAMVANYDNIRDAISRVIDGCEDYNERVRRPGGFYLKNPPRERIFITKSGKAQFKTSKLERTLLEDGQLLLTTIRSHNQFNTTIYDDSDRYRGIDGGRRVIFMNEADIAKLNLEAGQIVDITSYFEDGERYAYRFAVVPYPIPAGCAAAYFPEANPLIPLGSVAKRSGTPTSKCVIVSVRPAKQG